MKDKRNILFVVIFFVALLFIVSPLMLRIPYINIAISWFLGSLGDNGLKSSYIETVGSMLGTILAITGTLWLQRLIDKKADKEKIEREKNETKYKAVIIYYDLKIAFKEIEVLFNLSEFYGKNVNEFSVMFLNDGNDIKLFYLFAGNFGLYIDEGWIRNVASLNNEFKEELLEKIFLTYENISLIRTKIKSDNQTAYQFMVLKNLLDKFYNMVNGNAFLKPEYKNMLDSIEEFVK